jgi:hypothetical protein
MSISHLQAAFATQTGRDILPENLPLNVLISLARELAFLREGKLENYEIEQLKTCLCSLLERLLGMQPAQRLHLFRQNEEEILPSLIVELDKSIRNELANRLIENHSLRTNFEKAFGTYFR